MSKGQGGVDGYCSSLSTVGRRFLLTDARPMLGLIQRYHAMTRVLISPPWLRIVLAAEHMVLGLGGMIACVPRCVAGVLSTRVVAFATAAFATSTSASRAL